MVALLSVEEVSVVEGVKWSRSCRWKKSVTSKE